MEIHGNEYIVASQIIEIEVHFIEKLTFKNSF